MHSRDRREFGRRKMRIRNKWEVVLVLTVIAAGIVITTVAAIKAKERRQLHVENKSAQNTNKSSVSHVREVSDNRSGDHITRDQNRKRITPLDSKVVKKVVDTQPDYDVEYDLVKSGPEEYTALASESIDSIPRNRLRIAHDGLPGFPPPQGISNQLQYNSDVELSADAAGFLLESVDQTNGESAKDQVEYRDVISKPSDLKTNSEFQTNIRTNVNKVKNNLIQNENHRNYNNNNHNNEQIVPKSEPKRIPMAPIFVDPPKEVLESNIRLTPNKASEPKHDMKIAIPVKIMSRLPINKERLSNLGVSDSMRIALPNLEPAIRILGLSEQFQHSGEFMSPALQAAIDNIPVHLRRFISDGDKQETIHSVNSNGKSIPKLRSKRESERRFILRQYKPSGSTVRDQLKESEPKTGESRYIPISERSFIPEDRDDNDGEDSETESESDDENVRSLFNFDDLENRFPSVLSSNKESKRIDENYSTDESRNKQKYGILGSGNFEIIRGGIYAEDESATDNVPNYVSDSDNESPQMESDSNEQKTDQTESEHQTQFDNNPQSDPNSEDDNESNRFSPFNIDFFTGTPILGFQGYDNFGATSVDKYKAPAPSPIRSTLKVNGQRRHFYDPFSADSNLHVIATDEDLYSDS